MVHRRPGVLIVADAGYDAPRLAFLLEDLPVQLPARMRQDRFLSRAVPSRQPHTRGRPRRHGVEFIFGQPDTWGTPDTETVIDTRVYDTTTARPWDRLMTVGTIRAYGAINADRHSVRWDMNADVTKMKRLLRLRSPGCGRCLCMEFWHICAVIAGVPSDSKRSADAPSPTGSERGIQASGLSGCRSRWSTR
ncbi:transposase [Streptomyces sp. NBC_01579]|nr:transposase [Streptomyces sp. NBC_00562]